MNTPEDNIKIILADWLACAATTSMLWSAGWRRTSSGKGSVRTSSARTVARR
jgi:hypothetical protein